MDTEHERSVFFSKKNSYECLEKFTPRRSTPTPQPAPPGPIQVIPNTAILFGYGKNVCHVQVVNSSARRVGFGIKTTNNEAVAVDPPCGVLDPKEAVLLVVSCDAFAYSMATDRITIEWTNTPDGTTKQFRREWFQKDGFFARKTLPIVYKL